MDNDFYFNKYEYRKPYPSIPNSELRTLLFQFFGILSIFSGVYYLTWRWRFSLNYDAIWFAFPLVCAETLSFISTALMVFGLWSNKDARKLLPVRWLSEIEELYGRKDRLIGIDIYIATYNEDVELVRLSIKDAKKMKYPYADVKINIYVLDDGKRNTDDHLNQNMKKVAEEEGVGYIIRNNNKGYKAGNLKNGLENTHGDLFVILDADTRTFSEFLINTTGYFRNRKVAWVQTPQWFYDTTPPEKLSDIFIQKFGLKKKWMKSFTYKFFSNIEMNEDIFGNDPKLFYDVILRKRNLHNAAFCCGAGSIHRREAVMNMAVKDFANHINNGLENVKKSDIMKVDKIQHKLILEKELIPFKYHASEDIYTSMMLHSDRENKWESIQHPDVECKMLSTQDIDSWIKQHKRYSEGSLDIALKSNPLLIKGLTIQQRISYFTTIWSYFSPLWIMIFLLSPIVFFFTQALPVTAYSYDFFKHFLFFQITNTIMITIGCWGITTKRGDQYYISGFWYMLLSIFSVIKSKSIKFHVTPKSKQSGNDFKHIWPHICIISLSFLGIAYNSILYLFYTHPNPSGFLANTFWCIFNVIDLSIMIRASYWRPLY